MFRNRLYYRFKPLVPWPVRMGVRRWLATRQRARVGAEWPIYPGSEKAPAAWPGWPDGNAFAFVLTHDVEGPDGLANCRALAELEMSLGFRSCFNFIPEGDYRVPPELLTWLAGNGFEVGVHDLYHDGTLHRSRRDFHQQAERINHHLRNWNAVGFRAGFMRHNLDWQHVLDVQYDCSTFDTDPFEPQPDGQHTIFPLWVPNPTFNPNPNPLTQDSEAHASRNTHHASESRLSAIRSQPSTLNPQPSDLPSSIHHPPSSVVRGPSSASPSRNTQHATRITHHATELPSAIINSPSSSQPRPGYVELPYTLPQDSTLFLLFREPGPEIWLRKLDWVAQQGGMSLVNVHPDYVRFPGQPASPRTFPVEFYARLLEYVRDRYAGAYWSPLPRAVASWYASTASTAVALARNGQATAGKFSGRRAAVLLYSQYPADPRPRREAEALASEGMEVELICLRDTPDEPARETINGVRVRRVPLRRRRREGKLTYLFQYSAFIVLCAILLARRTVRRRYDLVHVHNMPDVLVLAALVPKFFGARVILDLHDPMPELMMTIYNLPPHSRLVGLLRLLEKWSIAFADQVVTVNLACKKIFGARSCPPAKIEVIMNSPDESIFPFRPCPPPADPPPRDPSRPFVLMCHGSIVERHGHDLAVAAVARLRAAIPSIELRIYGRETAFLDRVLESVREQKLETAVKYLGGCDLEGIVAAIAGCDLGIIPNRRAIFTELNTPTRIFEYLACGVPVISPRAPGILDYFNEQQMIYFELGDADDLARQIAFVYTHPREVAEFVRQGQDVYRNYRWREERSRLVRMTSGLLAARPGRSAAAPAPSV